MNLKRRGYEQLEFDIILCLFGLVFMIGDAQKCFGFSIFNGSLLGLIVFIFLFVVFSTTCIRLLIINIKDVSPKIKELFNVSNIDSVNQEQPKDNGKTIRVRWYILLMAISSLGWLKSTKQPILDIVTGDFDYFIFIIITVVTLSVIVFFRFVKTKIWVKKLEYDNKNTFTSYVIALIYIVFIVSPMLFWVYKNFTKESHTIGDKDYALPIVRLAEIEGNPNFKSGANYDKAKVDLGNRVVSNSSFVCSKIYTVEESGIIKDLQYKDKDSICYRSLYSKYYKLRLPSLKNKLIKDLISEFVERNHDVVERRKNKNFDELYTYTDEECKIIIASWDNKVVYVEYFGDKDINHVTSVIEELSHK